MSRHSLSKDMPARRAAAKKQIDLGAEAIRLNYITAGAGQAMAYQEKYEEAVALIVDLEHARLTGSEPKIGAEAAPHIFAEIGITGATAEEVATVVVGMRTTWKFVSADIEHKRLSAKAEADTANNPNVLQAILEEWL